MKEPSVPARVEVRTKYATACAQASKKARSRIVGQIVKVTGCSRDRARPQPKARLV